MVWTVFFMKRILIRTAACFLAVCLLRGNLPAPASFQLAAAEAMNPEAAEAYLSDKLPSLQDRVTQLLEAIRPKAMEVWAKGPLQKKSFSIRKSDLFFTPFLWYTWFIHKTE